MTNMVKTIEPIGKRQTLGSVAVFDFDGTLTTGDSLLALLRWYAGTTKFVGRIVHELPMLISYFLGRVDNQTAKEALLQRFFGGASIEELRNSGQLFADTVLQRMLRTEAMDRLRWHQASGHRCILISASLDIYLKPWSCHENFDDLICSQLAVDHSGLVTGKLFGENCFGQEKVRRLQELIGDITDVELFAYGDSRGDQELLHAADHAFFRCFS